MTVIPAALSISLWYYACTKRMRYQLTNKRLVFENGLVALDIEDVDLLRIRDVKCHQSLLMRLVDIGDIEVVLHSGAVHILRGVAGVRRLRQLIRNAVEERHEQCPRIARTMLYPVDPWAQH